MAPTSSSGKPKKLPKPLPAHRCGSRVCCNFIVPPTRAKYKYQFCSDECGRAQRRYEWHYSTCRTCPAEIKRESNRYYCGDCGAKRDEHSAALIARGKVPRKPCGWVFCQKLYQPRSNGQKYCSDECRKGAATSGQPSGPGYPTTMPSERTEYSFCTGNCGRSHYVGGERHAYNRLCRGCALGRKYGTLRPFGPPLPTGWERCHWVFCNALFQPENRQQRGCCSQHEKLPEAGAEGWPTHHGRGYASHKCANNCGSVLYSTSQPVCLPCVLGLRYGRVNPFPDDARERARWGEPVVHLTDKQMAAEWDYLLPPKQVEQVPPVEKPFLTSPARVLHVGATRTKTCAWAFCGEVFSVRYEGQQYCSVDCRVYAEYLTEDMDGTVAPSDQSDHLCRGGCGLWVEAYRESCFACVIGERFGKRNPYPPVGTAPAPWFLAEATSDDGDWLDEAPPFDWNDDELIKSCAWVFCGEEFMRRAEGQAHCSPECRARAESIPGGRKRGRAYPEAPTNVLCEGGCGLWMPGPIGGLKDPDDGHTIYTDICYGCFVGQRYGKRNTYPPLPTDRTAARYFLTEQDLAEEMEWLPSTGTASVPAVGEGEFLSEDWEWLMPDPTPAEIAGLFPEEGNPSQGLRWVRAATKKRCAWAFCGEPFRPVSAEQRYCSSTCADHDEKRAEWGFLPIGRGWAYPKERTDVLCAGGCGVWLQGGLLERCFPCEVGRKYGKRNPYPPVPTDRTAAGYYLSQVQMAAELDWLPAQREGRAEASPFVLAVLAGVGAVIAGALCAWWAAGGL